MLFVLANNPKVVFETPEFEGRGKEVLKSIAKVRVGYHLSQGERKDSVTMMKTVDEDPEKLTRVSVF